MPTIGTLTLLDILIALETTIDTSLLGVVTITISSTGIFWNIEMATSDVPGGISISK